MSFAFVLRLKRSAKKPLLVGVPFIAARLSLFVALLPVEYFNRFGYKRHCVGLLMNGYPLRCLVRDLRIPRSTLRGWRARHIGNNPVPVREQEDSTLEGLKAENARLRRENETMCTQHDSLRIALCSFLGLPGRST